MGTFHARMRRAGAVVALALVIVPSGIRAQGITSNAVVDAARAAFVEHRKNIVASFESMPADKYTFKPTPPLMSFSELATHIASANVYYCRRLGASAPPPTWLKPTAPKDQLVHLLAATFEYCAPVLAALTDASLAAPQTPVPNKTADLGTRAKALLDLIAGMDHHYAQAAGYLRLNGIAPPTAVEIGKPQP